MNQNGVVLKSGISVTDEFDPDLHSEPHLMRTGTRNCEAPNEKITECELFSSEYSTGSFGYEIQIRAEFPAANARK